ncbi:MAG TPA: ferredoxin [Candidatus Dormibacteraeota bacterium]|nr:ferredoxin [Candidatus Dormibacteraeota bacterium]
MTNWIWRGLRGGILATRYPFEAEAMPPRYRGGVQVLDGAALEEYRRGEEACLPRALTLEGGGARVDRGRCIQCGQCQRVAPNAYRMTPEFELALVPDEVTAARERLRARVAPLGRSVHLRHVDAGSDASCEQELQALFNPFYDLQRLGIFLTASPRHADVLVVTGVVTTAMADPLRLTFEAMPEPKIVMAVGTSACSGGIFAADGDVVGPVDRVLPVDVRVPGSPPAPLAIIHGLWVALGRATAHAREAVR